MSNAYNLRLTGYTIAQLQAAGYTDAQILGAGYNASELRLASYTALQLKNAGYTSRSIVEGGYNDKQLKSAGIKTAYELRKMGYSAFQIANAGYSGKIFKELKFTPTELLDPEVPPTQMRSFGYCIADMKTAGFNPHELIATGFELKRIITAGYGLTELFVGTATVDDIKNLKIPAIKTLYTPTDLTSAGLPVYYLRRVGFTANELKASGFTATDLRTGGYDPIQIHNAGYSLSEMKEAGHLSYEVSSFGYKFNDLVSAGYTGEELKSAGYKEYTDIIVLGYTSVSGFVNFMTSNNATSYNNGSIIIAGGIGIAKDLYLNELSAKFQMNVDVSGQMVHDGTNLRFIQLIENGIIRFSVNENRGISLIATNIGDIDFQFPNRTIEVKYSKVNIPSTSLATSTTTGALTCVGGISTQNNVHSSRFVSCDASGNEAIDIEPSSIIFNSNSGIASVSNESINVGKNNSFFGTRLLSEPSAVLQINGATGIAFSFLNQQANSQTTTTDLTIASDGIVNVSNATQSIDPNSGSLQTNGAIGVGKNVNVEGNIQMWDILNSGTITQSSTSLQFLSGNSSTPTPSATSQLFGIRTAPSTSLSNADLHTHIYNNANTFSPKTILTQNCSLTSSHLFTNAVYIGTGYPFFMAIYLKQGEVIKGVVYINTSAGSYANCFYAGIYGKGYQPMRLAYTGSTALDLAAGFNYFPFETSWTVPTSDMYYLGYLGIGSIGNTLCINASTFLNYSVAGIEYGTLRKVSQYYGPATSLPTQIPVSFMYESNYVVYCGVYNDNDVLFAASVRVLINGYTGPVLQLRRSSDNIVQDFYTDSTQTFLSTQPNGAGTSFSNWIGINTAYITIWYNQTGLGNNAINATNNTTQPTLVLQDGKYVVRWISANETNLKFQSAGVNSHTIYSQFWNSNSSYGTIACFSDSTGNKVDFGMRFNSTTGININGDSNSVDWYYFSTAGTNKISYVNGVSSTNLGSLSSWKTLTLCITKPYVISSTRQGFQFIGTDGYANNRSINGYMTEIMFHNKPMPTSSMTTFYQNRLII